MIIAGASPRRYVKTATFCICGSNNSETADGYMLRGVWQSLKCLFIHATFCVIAAGASPGQTKNDDFFCNCGSNNWETVVDRQLKH